MKVLIAGDEAISRRLRQGYLERWGHAMVAALAEVLGLDGGHALAAQLAHSLRTLRLLPLAASGDPSAWGPSVCRGAA